MSLAVMRESSDSSRRFAGESRSGIDQAHQKCLVAESASIVKGLAKRVMNASFLAFKIGIKLGHYQLADHLVVTDILKAYPNETFINSTCLLVSGVLGASRFHAGDHWSLVALEIVSGVAGCFFGWGTVTGFAIDAALLASHSFLAGAAYNDLQRKIVRLDT